MKQQQKTRRKRARDWREYNQALVSRGSLTLWVTKPALNAWRHHVSQNEQRRRGAQRVYSDMAITLMATLQQVYRLPLRATEGMLASILGILKLPLPIPDYSTLCRRRRELSIPMAATPSNEPLHVLIDSTGIKVYGNGEWMRLKHHQGKPAKHRRWLRLHIAVDAETLEIIAAEVTDNSTTDGQMLPPLLEAIDGSIKQVTGDAAYDKRKCYTAIAERNARATIRPQKRARIWYHGNLSSTPHDRDENLRTIRKRGRKKWKRLSGYSIRALVETTMGRLKMIFGDRVRSHHRQAQRAELLLRCAVLNRMTALGLPPARMVPT